MEFEYQWEEVAINISKVKPGQLFKIVIYPALIYKCNTVDWARQRLFLEIYEFDRAEFDLKSTFLESLVIGTKQILDTKRKSGLTNLDVIVEKFSYEVC